MNEELPQKAYLDMERHVIPVPEAGCWLWTSTTTKSGYGQFRAPGVTIYAHRLSWMMNRGPIPTGIFVCHKCDTPSCVNPDHLFLGTFQDNVDDCVAKGRNRPRPFDSGEKHHAARLTAEQVRFIFTSEIPYRVIAKMFDTQPSNVESIRRRKIWKEATADLELHWIG